MKIMMMMIMTDNEGDEFYDSSTKMTGLTAEYPSTDLHVIE